jgi:hypothetical protein
VKALAKTRLEYLRKSLSAIAKKKQSDPGPGKVLSEARQERGLIFF